MVPVEVVAPGPGEDHKGCLICTTSRVPTAAYRPHTLDGDCWCVRDSGGTRYLARCWVAKAFLAR